MNDPLSAKRFTIQHGTVRMWLTAIIVAAALPACSPDGGKVAKVEPAPPATIEDTVESMRSAAIKEPAEAFAQFATAEGRAMLDRFSGELWEQVIPREGWQDFFASAVSLEVPASDVELVPLYHPWSDVALITVWERQGSDTLRLTDAEVLPGRYLRRPGPPPYETFAEWTERPEVPAIAVATMTQLTADAVGKQFGPDSNGKAPALRHWRSLMPGLQKPENLTQLHEAAKGSLARNLAAQLDFMSEAPANGVIRAALFRLAAGKLDEVLAEAAGTTRETAELLRRHMAPHWKNLHLACWADGSGASRYVIFDTSPPGMFVSFQLAAEENGPPRLVRLDLVSHRAFREYVTREQ